MFFTENIAGSTSTLSPSPPDPKDLNLIYYLIRTLGIFLLTYSLLIVAISVKSYRNGEKWAWYTFWVLPVISYGLTLVREIVFGVPLTEMVGLLNIILGIVALLGLLLPYRKFFPRKP